MVSDLARQKTIAPNVGGLGDLESTPARKLDLSSFKGEKRTPKRTLPYPRPNLQLKWFLCPVEGLAEGKREDILKHFYPSGGYYVRIFGSDGG
jgi:hypothetical protein